MSDENGEQPVHRSGLMQPGADVGGNIRECPAARLHRQRMIRLSERAVRSGSQAGILRRVAVRHAIPAFGGHLRPIGYSISKIGALLKQRLLRRRIFSQPSRAGRG
jgi:hypothetical protein